MDAARQLRPAPARSAPRDVDRAAGRHRLPTGRVTRARPRRCRPGPRRAARARGQTEQAAGGSAAPEHGQRATRLRAPAGRPLPDTVHAGVLPIRAGTSDRPRGDSTRRSSRWSARSAWKGAAPGPARGRMTCGMPLPCTRCSTGTGPARTSTGACRCCPRISGTSTRPAPTGTWRPLPSCSNSSAGAWASCRGTVMSPLAPALQAFFTDRLITQRNASPQTIAAYRDTFRLLLRFAHAQTGKQPFRVGHRRSSRTADRRLPHPPGTRPRQQRPYP